MNIAESTVRGEGNADANPRRSSPLGLQVHCSASTTIPHRDCVPRARSCAARLPGSARNRRNLPQAPSRTPDARERSARVARLSHSPSPRQQTCGADTQSAETAVHCQQAKSRVGPGYHVCAHVAGMVAPGRGDGSLLGKGRRLGYSGHDPSGARSRCGLDGRLAALSGRRDVSPAQFTDFAAQARRKLKGPNAGVPKHAFDCVLYAAHTLTLWHTDPATLDDRGHPRPSRCPHDYKSDPHTRPSHATRKQSAATSERLTASRRDAQQIICTRHCTDFSHESTAEIMAEGGKAEWSPLLATRHPRRKS